MRGTRTREAFPEFGEGLCLRGSEAPRRRPRSHSVIRNPRDFWGGLSLVLLAALAVWASGDLPGKRGFAFGPGTAPRLFAYSLMGLGAAASLVVISVPTKCTNPVLVVRYWQRFPGSRAQVTKVAEPRRVVCAPGLFVTPT